MNTRQALRELLEQIDTLSGIEFSRDVDPLEAETCWAGAMQNAFAALESEDKAESELVEALEYIAAPQYGVSSGTAWDQLMDVRNEARKALAKHAKE